MNAILHFLAEPWAVRLGWVLVHFLWQGFAIALVLTIILRCCGGARLRYFFSGLALLSCVVAPAVTWTALAPSKPSPTVSTTSVIEVTFSTPAISTSAVNPPVQPHQRLVITRETSAVFISLVNSSLPGIVAAWFAGVLFLALKLALSAAFLQRLRLSGINITNSALQQRFDDLLHRMKISAPIRLIESALVEVPTLIGWLRPVILLPTLVLTGLTPDELDAILAHELAHVRRHDYLINLLQVLIETVLFYHPAVWWIGRKLREERENCCDDLAIEFRQDRVVYVRALAQLEQVRAHHLVLAASDGLLLRRIQRLAGFETKRRPFLTLLILSLILVCLATVIAASVSPPSVSVPEPITPKSERERILGRLHAICVYINVKNQDIAKVLQALTEKSVAFDPQRKGINFVLNLETLKPGDSSSPSSGIHRQVTLKLANAPLDKVLESIVQQTKLSYVVDDYAVYLRPPEQPAQPLTTRTFLAPPNFFPNPEKLAFGPLFGGTDANTRDVKQRLFERGIHFPKGANATWLPDSNKLVARNTPEELDHISDLIEKSSKTVDAWNPLSQPAPASPASPPPTSASSTPDILVTGHIVLDNPAQVDFTKSGGSLIYVDGHVHDFALKPDGSFEVAHLVPGTYSRTIHLVQKVPALGPPPVERYLLAQSLLVEARNHAPVTMLINVIDPFGLPQHATMVAIEMRLVEMDDSVYQANRAVIDADLERGDDALVFALNNMKGVDLITTPTVTTKPNLKANIDIVREFPYPLNYSSSKSDFSRVNGGVLLIPPTPREFVTKDVGISAEITPTLDDDAKSHAPAHPENGKIVLNGELKVTEFEGFIKSNLNEHIMTPSFETKESHFIEGLHDGQWKGFWIPERYTEETITDTNTAGKKTTTTVIVKKRRLLMLTADLIR